MRLTRRLDDMTVEYRKAGSPHPFTEEDARERLAHEPAWTGYVAMRLRGAGWQIVLVRAGRWPWRRLVKRGVVRRPRSTELISGMRLTDPMGHRAVVLSGYPEVELRWRHLSKPVVYRRESVSTVWHAAV